MSPAFVTYARKTMDGIIARRETRAAPPPHSQPAKLDPVALN